MVRCISKANRNPVEPRWRNSGSSMLFLLGGVSDAHISDHSPLGRCFCRPLPAARTFQCFSKPAAEVIFPPHELLEDGFGWRSEESVYWTCFKSELYVGSLVLINLSFFLMARTVQGDSVESIFAWIQRCKFDVSRVLAVTTAGIFTESRPSMVFLPCRDCTAAPCQPNSQRFSAL